MGRRLDRWLFPLYRSLETSVHPLRYLFLEITQRCNLSCRHCGSDCGRDPRPGELTAAEWTAFLERLARDFSRRRVVLVLTGGEPLCAPHLAAIVGKIHSLRFAWGIVTNGWALTPRLADGLLARGLQSVTVSLDGPETAHDRLRGRAGSFRRAVSGLRHLARAGLPFLDVVTCVHPGNLGELPKVRDLLLALGVPRWRLFSIFPRGRARGSADLLLDAAGFRRLLVFIAAERRATAADRLSVSWSCEGYLPADVDDAVRDQPYFCRAGIDIGSVLCDGAISACPNLSRALVQGNVRTDDFRQVWEERFAEFRDRAWLRAGRCAGCADWSRCRGNSLHLWDEERGGTARCFLDDLRGA